MPTQFNSIEDINDGIKVHPGKAIMNIECFITKSILLEDCYVISRITNDDITKLQNNEEPSDLVRLIRLRRGHYDLYGEYEGYAVDFDTLNDAMSGSLDAPYLTGQDFTNDIEGTAFFYCGGIIKAIEKRATEGGISPLQVCEPQWYIQTESIRLLDSATCNKITNSDQFDTLEYIDFSKWDNFDNSFFALFDVVYNPVTNCHKYRPKIPENLIPLVNTETNEIKGFLKLDKETEYLEGTYKYSLLEPIYCTEYITIKPQKKIWQYGECTIISE